MPSYEEFLCQLGKVKINGRKPHVIDLKYVGDYNSFIEASLLTMSGHCGFQQFKIIKKENEVKLFLKKDELECDWMFPMGVKLLDNIPSSLKLEAAPFRENSDYGSIYESVMKKYFPTLTDRFHDEKVEEFKSHWEERMHFLVEPEKDQFCVT